jgi:hypothetical protein
MHFITKDGLSVSSGKGTELVQRLAKVTFGSKDGRKETGSTQQLTQNIVLLIRSRLLKKLLHIFKPLTTNYFKSSSTLSTTGLHVKR